MISKEKLLAWHRSLKTEEMPIPELGDSVLLRELNGHERELIGSLASRARTPAEDLNAKLKVIELGMVEPKLSLEEIKERYKVDYEWMHRAHIRILDLSGLLPEAAKEQAKNLEGVQSARSGSSSPAAPDSLQAPSSGSGAVRNSGNS